MRDDHGIAALDQLLRDQRRCLAIVFDTKDLPLGLHGLVRNSGGRGSDRLRAGRAKPLPLAQFPVAPVSGAASVRYRLSCKMFFWMCEAGRAPPPQDAPPMRQPQSIRFHLTAVFLLFFLLVVVLGPFSIWRLSNFSRLSADVAEVWLPNTRALGDLNNFTSDFRAIEGSDLLSTDPSELTATERQMAELDRLIAEAERDFERIRHDVTENDLYGLFKLRWNEYRTLVNQITALSRADRKAEAQALYRGASHAAYEAASDTLGQLTDQAVANAQTASERLGVAYRQAFWLIVLGIVIAGVMVVAALVHIRRSISAPLLQLADRMRRLAANNTDIDIPETGKARRDWRDGASHRGLPQQCDRIDAQPADACPAGRLARGAIGPRTEACARAAQFRVDGVPRIPHAADHHRRSCAALGKGPRGRCSAGDR